MRGSELIHPVFGLTKEVLPVTGVLENFERNLSLTFVVEQESCLILGISNAFWCLGQSKDVFARNSRLEVCELLVPVVRESELVSDHVINWDVSGMVAWMFSVHNRDDVFTIFATRLSHTD